ncbi:lipid III flippase WzxE [Lonsdalea britannica]|uniref:Lipid III flippase n=1 Tax=Lonsdalea britannica TaxID=1082704 RepID=A0AAD0WKC9_9GAMM|nr:lipid III flippase WzxE [Lonsdalea britannica]AXW86253.1 lipid III flippase WzxE [Lonsdalea britannica]OSN06006.1 O-antigen translocase [Lonsdalea britannica]
MSLAKASVWTAASTLIKIGVGLVVVKLLAVSFGPGGVGLAGNYRQLITVLGVLAGAGIFNGVTKYVAEYQQRPAELRSLLGTATTMVTVFSLALALVLWLAALPIAEALFGETRFASVIRALALLQVGIAYANLFLAILKGYRHARGNALAIILGSIVGLAAYLACFWLGGYDGALVGLALVPALIAVPAAWWLQRATPLRWPMLKPLWERMLAGRLAKFTLMALMTAVTLPVAYITMRNLLAAHYGWEAVGIWQGVTTISDAYLQFITAAFSVYLLPTLSRLTERRDQAREIVTSLKFVLPTVAAVSFVVWLLRDVAIWLLFSHQFIAMRDLFPWQLTGDVMKVGAYVFGYLVIAKASLRFYLLTEISQFLLLMGFSHWLIPLHGALGAAQAYMASYLVYFLLCCGIFIIYCRRA